jgi:predicted regulator of Ras-like GTPase activity (Roadblock/LC7/MglB family)
VRATDLPRVIAAVKAPIGEFVRESHVRTALLISSSGQVVAQHGFVRSLEVMNIASLAAAAHSAARALAQLCGTRGWHHLHHAGREQQLFLAPLEVPGGELILVAIFDHDSSIGLAQFFFNRLAQRIRELPVFAQSRPTADARAFDRDLEAGLEGVFGRRRETER